MVNYVSYFNMSSLRVYLVRTLQYIFYLYFKLSPRSGKQNVKTLAHFLCNSYFATLVLSTNWDEIFHWRGRTSLCHSTSGKKKSIEKKGGGWVISLFTVYNKLMPGSQYLQKLCTLREAHCIVTSLQLRVLCYFITCKGHLFINIHEKSIFCVLKWAN